MEFQILPRMTGHYGGSDQFCFFLPALLFYDVIFVHIHTIYISI